MIINKDEEYFLFIDEKLYLVLTLFNSSGSIVHEEFTESWHPDTN